uniref:Bm997 n=1 Tax=Brugia malayi TaxID=6279 RepID=A0A0J9Y3V1_BRUMA|nr:Bm997 [Brugia malayi]
MLLDCSGMAGAGAFANNFEYRIGFVLIGSAVVFDECLAFCDVSARGGVGSLPQVSKGLVMGTALGCT